jgi:FkbM family methyltransferase
VSLSRRIVAAGSRRIGRPELLAALYPGARVAQREELAIEAILPAVLAAQDSYVDVGANRGQILREAARVAPSGSHFAFEPIPSVAAELARAFPGVDCRQVALGASPGEAEFCHFRKLEGWSGLRRSPEISDERGDPEFITVRVSTLDVELAGSRPRLIKIDVEGAELDVLRGARETLTQARPLLVFEHVAAATELYGASSAQLWELLQELGYEVFSVTGDGPYGRDRFVSGGEVVNWLARPR